MKIGNVELKNDLFLAPMAGVTDFAFRALAREYGAGFSYSEMVSAKGLVYNGENEEYKKMLHTLPVEKPVSIQLFGSEPKFMAMAAALPCVQKFDIVDINMGCPAPKVIRNGDGSALLKDVKKAGEVARAVVTASGKPVTVKMRLGFDKNENVSIEFGRILQDSGVSAICLHGRTREQFYSGESDFDAIAAFKAKIDIPVIGNGDVLDLVTYNKMKQTGVDAVMIGRGSLGKPWIFDEILSGKKLSLCEKGEVIIRHIDLLSEIYPERFIVNHMRKHLLWYVKDFHGANKLRMELCKISSILEAKTHIKNIFFS